MKRALVLIIAVLVATGMVASAQTGMPDLTLANGETHWRGDYSDAEIHTMLDGSVHVSWIDTVQGPNVRMRLIMQPPVVYSLAPNPPDTFAGEIHLADGRVNYASQYTELRVSRTAPATLVTWGDERGGHSLECSESTIEPTDITP